MASTFFRLKPCKTAKYLKDDLNEVDYLVVYVTDREVNYYRSEDNGKTWKQAKETTVQKIRRLITDLESEATGPTNESA